MSNNSPENGAPPAPLRAWHGWWPLAVTLSLSAFLVAIIFWGRDRDDKPNVPPQPSSPPSAVAHGRMVRVLPQPSDAALFIEDGQASCYSIVSEERDGAQVLRIRTHAGGDELIVDAFTGRLVAVRDYRGKTITWPVSPMSINELPAKAS